MLLKIIMKKWVVLVLFATISVQLNAQQPIDRMKRIYNILNTLTIDLPGLNQKIQLDVADVPIADFMRGLAQSYNLNINIAPDVSQKMTNHFSSIPVLEVLIFLANQYNLDYDFQGTIINVRNYRDPKLDLPPPVKVIDITYNAVTALLTLDLKDDLLTEVTKKITQLTGANITVLSNASGNKVNGYYKSLPVHQALNKMAVANRLKLGTNDNQNFILEALGEDEDYVTNSDIISNNGYTINRKISVTDKNTPSRLSVQSQKTNDGKLLKISAINTPLQELIRSISQEAGVPYFVYADLKGNVTAEARELPYSELLQKILLGTPYSFSQQNGIYMIGEKTFEGIKGQRLVQLHHRSVDSLGYFLPDDLKKDVVIKEFKELNAFLITGSEPQLNKIESLVKQIDLKVPLITIEVIIMDVTKGRVTKAGLRAGVNYDSLPPFGGNLLGGGLDFTVGSGTVNRLIDRIGLNNLFNLGHVTPNFYANLQAIENLDNVEMRQTPKLSTLNGHAATLSIGNTRYYSVSTQNVMGSLSPNVITTQQYYPIEANLSLNITPFVSADEDVTLNIEMDISNFTAETPVNQPPPTATSKFKSIIRVKNDDMILLGGIERTEKGESSSGIPLLSRIPILKWLFSSRAKKNNKVVSVVFIKPTIVYN